MAHAGKTQIAKYLYIERRVSDARAAGEPIKAVVITLAEELKVHERTIYKGLKAAQGLACKTVDKSSYGVREG